MDNNQNNWNEWSKHVIIELERLHKQLHSIDDKLDTHMIAMENRVASLESQNRAVSGYIKLLMSLVLTTISTVIAWITKQFF